MTKFKILIPAGLIVLAVLFGSGFATAQSITWVDSMTISGLSADGSVAAGNSTDGLYEACRWDAVGGVVRLGRSSSAAIGRSAGIPGISADGNAISSTIISSDTLMTQGIWTKGIGWVETMPPPPADGGSLDDSYGSAWGISGDGLNVVGFYWRPGASDGTAHCSIAQGPGTVVDLGSQGRDSRANGADIDGNVVVGWSASPTISVWQPTVWEDGVMTVLTETVLWCDAWQTNSAGDMVVGCTSDTLSYSLPMSSAALWIRTEAGWQEQILGVLPGTFSNGVGYVTGNDLSEDGTVVVGYNGYDNWTSAGFIWTQEQGMMKAQDYFTGLGITFPGNFTINSMTACSDDGLVMAGFGKDPFDFAAPPQSFIVDLHGLSTVPTPSAGAGLVLGGNFPNPFNPTTSIRLAVEKAGHVRLEIFDVRGHLVQVVHDGHLTSGDHVLEWNGRDSAGRGAASGVYFARARTAGGYSETLQMTLVK